MDFIVDYENSVVAANIADLFKLVLCPDSSYGIVGIAEQKGGNVFSCGLFLQVGKIDFIFSVVIKKAAVNYFSAFRNDRYIKRIVSRGENDNALAGFGNRVN